MEGLARQVQGDAGGFAVQAQRGLHRHLLEVVVRVALLLPAVRSHVLAEVALAVEQAHGHQGHVQVAGAFQVVARQHAQATGIDGQAHGDAVFQAEIGHGHVAVGQGRELEGRMAAHKIMVKGAFGIGQALQEEVVARQLLYAPLGQAVQKLNGILLAGHPKGMVNGCKDVGELVVPREPEIMRYVPENFQPGRKFGHDAEDA